MSLVTRCPACGTTFKVVRDQLRISDGWVRCGRCSEVFDATQDLSESADPPAAPAPAPPESPGEAEGVASEPVASEPAVEALADAAPTETETEAEAEPSPAGPLVEAETETEAEAIEPHQDSATEPDRWSIGPPQKAREAHEPPSADPSTDAWVEPDFFDDEQEDQEAAPAAEMPQAVPGLTADFARESWPEAEAFMLTDHGRTATRPPVPPPLSFPPIDLRLPAADGGVRAPPPVLEDTDNVQLAKALRRAHVKSAKIAKAKAREQKDAAVDLASVVRSASETELPAPGPALPVQPSPLSPPSSLSSASPLSSPAPLPELSPPFAAESRSFWQRAAGRRTLVGVAVLAALLLLLQVMHQERDLIVARQPSLRPLLAGLCRVTGCELSALRQINDIKIDGASFAREKVGDGFQLDFTLRNAAKVPLAMPAIELSLFDTQERAVVRRVLMPADFAAPAVLPADGERSASLSLHLSGPEVAALPPVVGFKVEALYP